LKTKAVEGSNNELPIKRSKALARSSLRRKAFWFQVLRLKEWMISWVTMMLEEMCLFLIKATWE
jgi:hypothetical protein